MTRPMRVFGRTDQALKAPQLGSRERSRVLEK